MLGAYRTLLALAVFIAVEGAWGGDDPKPNPEEKPAAGEKPAEPPAALLDKAQEVTLLLFNGKKRPVYLTQLTAEELAYKQSATGTEVVKYAAKDGAVLEIHTARGGTFLFNKTSNKFEVGTPEPPPPPDPKVAGEKPKAEEFQPTPLEQAILDLANEERKKEGLPPLKPQEKLFQLSRAHSANMARQNKLEHILDGKSPTDRARGAGYGAFVYENCAWGPRTAPEVIRMWMNSPGHKANLLNKYVNEAGVGMAVNDRGGPFYTMMFGIRRTP
jgi:uncharacterized protein YkwD